MAVQKRQRLFIDRKIQGALLRRVAMYWTICVVTVFVILACYSGAASPEGAKVPPSTPDLVVQTWNQYWPVIVGCALLLPVVLIDILFVSHRFVGPLLRVRKSIRLLSDGEKIEPIQFRKGDFWMGFAAEINQLVDRIEELEAEARRESVEEEPTTA